MKAISLWQPWASLMATGAKGIETRSWATKYRGPLAIHAARRCVKDEIIHYLSMWQFQGGLAPLVGKPLDLTFQSWPGVEMEHLPFGAVIVVCELVDCVPVEELTLKQVYIEKYFGNFSPGRYAWIIKDIKALPKPVPAKGMQGLWEWKPPEGVEMS